MSPERVLETRDRTPERVWERSSALTVSALDKHWIFLQCPRLPDPAEAACQSVSFTFRNLTVRKAIDESYAKQARHESSTRFDPAVVRGHIDNDNRNSSSTLPEARAMLPTSIDKCPAACQTAQCVSIPSEIFHATSSIIQYIISGTRCCPAHDRVHDCGVVYPPRVGTSAVGESEGG